MLDNKLVRYSNLITDASGFYKAADYVYDSNGSKSWETSGIGIQINKELSNEEYGVIDFRFIQPKSAATAPTSDQLAALRAHWKWESRAAKFDRWLDSLLSC